MNNLLASKIGLISVALSVYTSVSHASEMPTHCKLDEYVVLTAKLFSEVKGELGDEMERIATTSNKFGLSQQSDAGAHAGEQSISFSQGKYVYQISEASGMAGFGVRLYVYESNNPIFPLMSAGYREGSLEHEFL